MVFTFFYFVVPEIFKQYIFFKTAPRKTLYNFSSFFHKTLEQQERVPKAARTYISGIPKANGYFMKKLKKNCQLQRLLLIC
jgi:hypothetical protein